MRWEFLLVFLLLFFALLAAGIWAVIWTYTWGDRPEPPPELFCRRRHPETGERCQRGRGHFGDSHNFTTRHT